MAPSALTTLQPVLSGGECVIDVASIASTCKVIKLDLIGGYWPAEISNSDDGFVTITPTPVG